jgi:hypothetical protein
MRDQVLFCNASANVALFSDKKINVRMGSICGGNMYGHIEGIMYFCSRY